MVVASIFQIKRLSQLKTLMQKQRQDGPKRDQKTQLFIQKNVNFDKYEIKNKLIL